MNWLTRLRILDISKIAIVVCLTMSLVLAGFTVYGNKVGNYVISTTEDNPKINIKISEYEDLSYQTSRLAVSGLKDQDATTLSDLSPAIMKGLGSKNDTVFKRYIAYSFYLVNNSETDVDIQMTIGILDETLGASSALRVMVIQGEEFEGTIYAKWNDRVYEESGEKIMESLDALAGYQYDTETFDTERQVVKKTITQIPAGESLKFTFVIWLEGWDAECSDDIKGGSIKIATDFYAY